MQRKAMTNDSLEFVIYVIYRLAEAWGINPSQVYAVLNKSGALKNYLIPCYDVLHTLGGEYLVEMSQDMFAKEGSPYDRLSWIHTGTAASGCITFSEIS